MITKNDCMSILIRLEDQGINIDQQMKKILLSKEVPIEVLKFIVDNQGMDAANFYEMLRKKHNKNKSTLYTNILKDILPEEELITTLSCFLTQIILFGRKLEKPEIFFKEVRAEEITKVLNLFFTTGSPEECFKLLKLIKSDLLVLEYIAGRREIENS